MLYQEGYTPLKRTKRLQVERERVFNPQVAPGQENTPEAKIERNTAIISRLQNSAKQKLDSLVHESIHMRSTVLSLLHARVDYHKMMWEKYSKLRDKLLKQR